MKKHKKLFNRAFLVTILLGVVFGCEDDEFLTQEPKTFFTVDNIFSSGEQVNQTLTAIYAAHRQLKYSDGGSASGRLMQGQGTDVMVTPAFRFSENFSDYTQINPSHPRITGVFNKHYEIIFLANTSLTAADKEGVNFQSDNERAYILAQARFFRALAHGSLAQLFGPVAVVTETRDEPKFDFVQSTRAEVYQFAIDELEAILNDLPETTDQSGRVVRGAAQHYLSEFYLSLGIETSDNSAYQQSVDYASDIIDGGVYSLMTERFGSRVDEPGKDVYWDLFRRNNINYSDGNLESIWTHQFDFGAFLGGDEDASLYLPRYWSPILRAIECVTGVAEDVGGRGVAFFAPTPLTETIIWDANISDGDIRGSDTNIRRTFLYNDPTCPDLLGQVVPQEVIDATNESLAGAVFPIYEKNTTDRFEGLDEGQNRSNLFRDNYIIRLPETILLRAEAYLRLGDNEAAANDINLIRNRSQATTLASAATVDLDFILDERARELFGEESRWNTLLRMGGTVAVDRIRTFAKHDWTTNSLTFDFNLFPIPQGVIDRNKDVIWKQNPGWENR